MVRRGRRPRGRGHRDPERRCCARNGHGLGPHHRPRQAPTQAGRPVALDEQCRLPQDPDPYQAFRHGYSIADLRFLPGKPRGAGVASGRPPGGAGARARRRNQLSLSGTIRNEFAGPLTSTATPRPLLLALTALVRDAPLRRPSTTPSPAPSPPFQPLLPSGATPGRADPAAPAAAAVGARTLRVLARRDVLRHPALYRFFLATRELALPERAQLKTALRP